VTFSPRGSIHEGQYVTVKEFIRGEFKHDRLAFQDAE
jgi:hypothetical protein